MNDADTVYFGTERKLIQLITYANARGMHSRVNKFE